MSRPPQVVYAKKGGTTRIHVPRKYLPIVVVPGVMGTRLVDEKPGTAGEGKLVFNPKGKPLGDSPAALVVDFKRLGKPAELAPAEGHGYRNESERNAVKHIRHFNNLVTDLYGELVKKLADLGQSEGFDHLGIRPVVYCAGYDWRQDNARSALRVAAVVEEALRETGAKKCILVAHSMGGLVARYYCRALGGESRVHQLYLIGSPTLGAPGAFVQLKHGVHGAYMHDLVEAAREGDVAGVVREGVQLASQIVRGIAGGDFLEAMGPLYFALCLGAGKLLRREETAYFARQLASIYQLMPNRIFCDQFKHWVVFDPIVTGHPPTGHMVVFPGVLEASMMAAADIVQELEGGASRAGEDARRMYDEALGLGRSERTSPRATRNVTTIDDIVNSIVDANKAAVDEGDWSKMGDVGTAVQALYERAETAFMDCRSPRHLYGDIYTGLMDNVQQRPLVAANLALQERFERALSIGPDREKEDAMSLFDSIIGPIVQAVGGGGERPRREEGGGEPERRLKAYMHPRTTNLYANHLQVELGCMLIPTDVVSNDDSNEVKYELVPFPIGLQGDGTVPADSANPAAAALSHPFEHGQVIAESHFGLPSAATTVSCLRERINLGLADWLKGEA
jgi:hypothetical protein